MLAGVALLAGACSELVDDDAVRGSGTIASEIRDVDSFDAVEIAGSGQVTIDVTGEQRLEIEADENILPLLTATVSARRLVLGVQPNNSISPSREIRYRINATEFREIVVLGSGEVTITGIDSESVGASVLGSGEVDLEGATDSLTISIPGSGTVDAEGLRTSIASVSIDGSGSVIVDVSDELEASINGSGSIVYIGDPAVIESINGSGTISAG